MGGEHECLHEKDFGAMGEALGGIKQAIVNLDNRQQARSKELFRELGAHTKQLAAIETNITTCMKQADEVKEHGERLAVVETQVEERHKKNSTNGRRDYTGELMAATKKWGLPGGAGAVIVYKIVELLTGG